MFLDVGILIDGAWNSNQNSRTNFARIRFSCDIGDRYRMAGSGSWDGYPLRIRTCGLVESDVERHEYGADVEHLLLFHITSEYTYSVIARIMAATYNRIMYNIIIRNRRLKTSSPSMFIRTRKEAVQALPTTLSTLYFLRPLKQNSTSINTT